MSVDNNKKHATCNDLMQELELLQKVDNKDIKKIVDVFGKVQEIKQASLAETVDLFRKAIAVAG